MRGLLQGSAFARTSGRGRTAGDKEEAEAAQEQTVIETGSRKPGSNAAPWSVGKRYGPDPCISMQASSEHQRATSTGRTHERAWPTAQGWTGNDPASQGAATDEAPADPDNHFTNEASVIICSVMTSLPSAWRPGQACVNQLITLLSDAMATILNCMCICQYGLESWSISRKGC